jgi:hypothetical protein
LAYLLENLDGLNKVLIIKFGLDSKYRELNKTQQNKLYRIEDRIQVIRLSKQSPLEIEILFTSLKNSLEISAILLESLGDSEDRIKLNLEAIINSSISDENWIIIYKRFMNIRRVIRLLNFTLIINNK